MRSNAVASAPRLLAVAGRVDRFRGLAPNAAYLLHEGEPEPQLLEGFAKPRTRP